MFRGFGVSVFRGFGFRDLAVPVRASAAIDPPQDLIQRELISRGRITLFKSSVCGTFCECQRGRACHFSLEGMKKDLPYRLQLGYERNPWNRIALERSRCQRAWKHNGGVFLVVGLKP